MADTVTNRTLLEGPVTIVKECIATSDGTGETSAIKIAVSALGNAPNGGQPIVGLEVTKIDYVIRGYNNVQLYYDHTTDILLCALSGNGTLCGPFPDTGSGGTGDLILTTSGQTAGAHYTLIITALKKYA